MHRRLNRYLWADESCVALCYNVFFFCEIFFWFLLWFVCWFVCLRFSLIGEKLSCHNICLFHTKFAPICVYMSDFVVLLYLFAFFAIVVRMEYLMKSILHILPTFFLLLLRICIRLLSTNVTCSLCLCTNAISHNKCIR